MKNRAKITQEKKAALVLDFKNSGMSMAAWCRKQNLSYHTFNGWLRRISSKGSFAVISPVQSKDSDACIGVIEVYLPNQTRLILRNVSDVGNILSILSRA
jgi:transposase-like protein